jgi:hypothetical protein
MENQITIKFDKEPTFAELWDACLYNLLYKGSKKKRVSTKK